MAKKPVTNTDKELEALLKRRRALLDDERVLGEMEKAAIDWAKALTAELAKPLEVELTDLDERLTKLLVSRKRSLTARLGKVITLPDGVIRYRIEPESLETPKNVSPILYFLQNMRGGDRYLKWTPTLDRDAITKAGKSLHRKLWPLGVWVGRHASISVKSTGEDEPKTLNVRRFRARHRK